MGISEVFAIGFALGFTLCFFVWKRAIKQWSEKVRGRGGDKGWPEFKHVLKK